MKWYYKNVCFGFFNFLRRTPFRQCRQNSCPPLKRKDFYFEINFLSWFRTPLINLTCQFRNPWWILLALTLCQMQLISFLCGNFIVEFVNKALLWGCITYACVAAALYPLEKGFCHQFPRFSFIVCRSSVLCQQHWYLRNESEHSIVLDVADKVFL